MILRNHGLLTCAGTVADAFLYMYILQRACEVQIKAQSGGAPLRYVAKPILDGMRQAAAAVTREANGQIAWPALLRKLDRIDPGYAD
jgi:ribulose-5-phosphate 4-epimerase/fuculose-1-phosphate aldolase